MLGQKKIPADMAGRNSLDKVLRFAFWQAGHRMRDAGLACGDVGRMVRSP